MFLTIPLASLNSGEGILLSDSSDNLQLSHLAYEGELGGGGGEDNEWEKNKCDGQHHSGATRWPENCHINFSNNDIQSKYRILMSLLSCVLVLLLPLLDLNNVKEENHTYITLKGKYNHFLRRCRSLWRQWLKLVISFLWQRHRQGLSLQQTVCNYHAGHIWLSDGGSVYSWITWTMRRW